MTDFAPSSIPTPTSDKTGLKITPLPGLSPLRVAILEGDLSAPATLDFPEEPNQVRFLVQYQGTALAVCECTKLTLIGPNSIALSQSGRTGYVSFGRGPNRWLYATWTEKDLSALYPAAQQVGYPGGQIPAAHFIPGEGILGLLANDVAAAFDDPTIDIRASLVALISATVQATRISPEGPVLAEIPQQIQGSLRTLLEAVKDDPRQSWSLKEAAAMAAYSPFHLSRTFRTIAPYGFPEFVDRCRTELALSLLMSSTSSIEDIAQSCGFGSAQAMRNACREYLGFLPSELRSGQLEG